MGGGRRKRKPKSGNGGRGQGSGEQSGSSDQPSCSSTQQQMDSLAISTSQPPTATGASSSTSIVSTREYAEEFKSAHMPPHDFSFGSFRFAIVETEETGQRSKNALRLAPITDLRTEMKSLAIPTSQPPTATGAIISTSNASTRESAEGFKNAQMSLDTISLGSLECPASVKTEETGQTSGSAVVPVNRPNAGGENGREIDLVANHFHVEFNPGVEIYHYDIDIQRVDNVSGKKGKEKKGPEKTEKEMKASWVSKEDALKIKNQLLKDNLELFRDEMIVFDRKKNIYSVKELPEGRFTVKLPNDQEGSAKEFSVVLKYTNHKLNGRTLAEFLNINERNHLELDSDLLQCLDLVMREHGNKSRILVGRSLYPMPPFKIRGGAMASIGYYQSLRPTAQGLSLNVDLSAIAFHGNMNVHEYLKESCIADWTKRKPLSEIERRNAKKALVGLKVQVIHRKCSQKFTIIGLTEQITKDIEFKFKGHQNMGMVDYFRKTYNTDIHCKWPCLDVSKSKDKPIYIPMELCVICEGQRLPRNKLSKLAEKGFDKEARPTADKRQGEIKTNVLSDDGPMKSPFLPRFGLTVVGSMTELKGRVLQPPTLQLRDCPRQDDPGLQRRADRGQIQLVTPDIKEYCNWNLTRNQVFDGKCIENWGLISFSDRPSLEQVKSELKTFRSSLVTRCTKVGVHMTKIPRLLEYHSMSEFDNTEVLRQTLLNAATAKGQLEILICVMEEKHDGYNTLKLIAETEIGLVTQCCLYKNSMNWSQSLANLALKINAKVGGSNAALNISPTLPRFDEDLVMYIGADVNHPGSGDTTSPSIAAVVGSINWPLCNRYNARVSYQTHRVEHIENLTEMSKELLDNYFDANDKLPARIIFFRDGVSESQFHMVLNKEFFAFKEAVTQFVDYKPRISIIVAQKRHHTRLFPADKEQLYSLLNQNDQPNRQHEKQPNRGNEKHRPTNDNKSVNVLPGTVVDTVIVHPRQFDFYLCSHHVSQGTSKPTHYHVLWDENDFGSDELETLINNLCYTFARCTKPVSLVPPVYYADLAAYRGRLYLQGSVTKTSEIASTSSSSSSSSQLKFPELHGGIKNTMFFC